MRRNIRCLALLLPLCLLCGCGGREAARSEAIRAHYGALTQYEAEVRLVLPRGEESFRCALHVSGDAAGAEASVLEPETLRGVSARWEESTLTLRSGSTVLDAGSLTPSVSAVNAVPLIVRAAAEGYVTAYSEEELGGVPALRVETELAHAGTTLCCTAWFGEDDALLYAELAENDKIIVFAEFTAFTFSAILEAENEEIG